MKDVSLHCSKGPYVGLLMLTVNICDGSPYHPQLCSSHLLARAVHVCATLPKVEAENIVSVDRVPLLLKVENLTAPLWNRQLPRVSEDCRPRQKLMCNWREEPLPCIGMRVPLSTSVAEMTGSRGLLV